MEYWNFRFMILDLRLTPSSSPLESRAVKFYLKYLIVL